MSLSLYLLIATTSFFLIFLIFNSNKLFYFLALFFSLATIFFQYKHAVPTDFFYLTEIESTNQLQRMNDYSPPTYRLANIIEARRESVAYTKIKNNFINIFDLELLFTRYYWTILFPLFIFGLLKLIHKSFKKLLLLFLLPIFLLTIIGHNSPVGPISLFPVINTSIFYGFYSILKHV